MAIKKKIDNSLVDKVEQFINTTSKLKVAVIGETIIDEFIDVTYEGQSMKSTCPVFKLVGEKSIQQGGAAAIAGHLKSFVKSVTLITNSNREIVKTRYVEAFDKKKHVEINKFDTKNFPKVKINTTDYDIVIVADFGHGFCDKLEINNGFHLMCQTNSNNFGFNRLSKWKQKRKKSVCMDLREASLQMNKKFKECTDKEAIELYNYEVNTESLFVTTGAKGSLYTNGKNIVRHPSFKTEIVDTIGAGDTFFAFACVSTHLKDNTNDPLLVPSLAASLSTTWLCNERSVTANTLLKHATRYL